MTRRRLTDPGPMQRAKRQAAMDKPVRVKREYPVTRADCVVGNDCTKQECVDSCIFRDAGFPE